MPHPWIIADVDAAVAERLAAEVGLSPVTARVLLCRGIATAADARRYLSPALADIPDPFLLPGMEGAAERIARALASREPIAIFGDYDVDGITGTAILALFFSAVGEAPILALPSRFGEGYGLTAAAVDALAAKGAALIVTVDNGTRAHEAIARAQERGIDVVVTDHHGPDGTLPPAAAIANPTFPETPEALRHLSGAGVAFLLALAVRKKLRDRGALPDPEPNLRQHLDLAALGTIADSVPLIGANRILARHGLAEIARSGKLGIRALLDVAGSDPARLTPGAVAFHLAPRINAAGRLSDAHRALELLLSDDAAGAQQIARELDAANRERQAIEGRILGAAMETIATRGLSGRPAIVLSGEGWHVGVIGIVAAKIAERFGRPAVVISRDAAPARGSARSFAGIDVAYALSRCSDSLVRFGGHAMAAGLSLEAEAIPAFAARFEEACAASTPPPPRSLTIDAALLPTDITGRLAGEIAACGPFGVGNSEPLFLLSDAEILSRHTVGNGHAKLHLRCGGIHFEAIGFGLAGALPADAHRASLAFVPELRTWQGVSSVQLKVRALAPASE